MRGAGSLAVMALLVLLPSIAAAEDWHGQIRCVIVPGMDTKPLVGEITVTTHGPHLTYERPVHNADSVTLSGVMETGQGMLSGSDVTLQGSAIGTGYSYWAKYQGQIQGDTIVLTGEQVWTASKLTTPFHRDCRITLKR
jgi:hypothetical protein